MPPPTRTVLLLATASLLLATGPARALCPERLPVALLEECIVAEGLGRDYPVEEALAEWRRRHPEKAADAPATVAGKTDALPSAPPRR